MTMKCQNCNRENEADSRFCIHCGAALPPPPPAPASVPPAAPPPADVTPTTVVKPVIRGKLVLPDSSEIMLAAEEKDLGREDLKQAIPEASASYISRRHLRIKSQDAGYYIEDAGSANGTRLNDVEIKEKGWQELKDGDSIDVAGVATLTFRLVNNP